MFSYKVNSNLFLVQHPVSLTKIESVSVPINHIVVIDCSGSMSNDLPKIREQLKNKLPKILGQDDTISIIWFSGKDEFGTLIEGEKINSLTDLESLNKLIDRWLKPVCLTGFKQPLEEVGVLINKLGGACSLFFMSDGCDNQWAKNQILEAIDNISDKLASATIVEYGYYADRNLLTAMAEKMGGALIFSENFNKYEPIFENTIQKKISGRPRKKIEIENAIQNFVYTFNDEDLIAFKVEDGFANVPEDVTDIWYLSKEEKGSLKKLSFTNVDKPEYASLYAALSLFSVRMKSDIVYDILKCLGDVSLINQFSGCFGKQKYSEFVETTKQAVFGEGRFLEGRDVSTVPKDDAFTVIELLNLLYEDDKNKVVIDSDLFQYNMIGRKAIDSSTMLTPDEQTRMNDIMNKMASTSDVETTKKLIDEMNVLVSNKRKPLKFVIDEEDKKNGYSVTSLVFSEERPNISILVKKNGTVDVSEYIGIGVYKPYTEGEEDISKIKTYIFRNYAIIKDGIVNVDILPVRLTKKTLSKLKKKIKNIDSVVTHIEDDLYTLNLRVLPVINRMMVKEVSAKSLFTKQFELIKLQAVQKVYNTYRKELVVKKSEGFVEKYGEATAKWLQELGITDFNGFTPKVVLEESTDFYMGKELNVKIKGYASFPSVKDVKERMVKGKLTPSASLMVEAITEVESQKGEITEGDGKKFDEFVKWLEEKSFEVIQKVRQLLFEMSQIKFAIIVGQIWFVEFESLEENTMNINVDGIDLNCMVELKEVEVKI